MSLSEDWSIGHHFGGATAAALLLAAADTAGLLDHVPISASAAFHKPVPPGEHEVRVQRVGGGRRFPALLASLGAADRASSVTTFATFTSAEHLPMHEAREPSELPPLAFPATGDLSAQVDWRLVGGWAEPAAAGEVRAWIRPRSEEWYRASADGGSLDPRWFLIASDLIGPALLADFPEPLRVATVTLDVSVHALVRGWWLQQRVTASRRAGLAFGRLELTTADGQVVATATQHAVISPAHAGDLPVSVTGYGWGGPPARGLQRDRTSDRY